MAFQIPMSRPSDKRLGNTIREQAVRMQRARKQADEQDIEALFRNDEERIAVRRSLIGNATEDPHGMERVIGRSDLCSINFLAKGLAAAAAVARIRVRDSSSGREYFGTGFLIAPGLLMTNHHVLPSSSVAEMAIVEFNYEHDIHGVECQKFIFNLAPGVVFVNNAALDVAFVEVVPRSFEGKPLTQFGFLPLLKSSGKALDGEWVSIIQHPDGLPKQIAVRDSQIVTLSNQQTGGLDPEIVIHYTTDTQPGSSGSPVLNDQWQVVALHHRGVPLFDSNGKYLCRDGKTVWKESMGTEELGWAANEGIRISAICRWLQEQRLTSAMHDSIYHRVRFGVPRPPASLPVESMAMERSGPTSTPESLKDRIGYDSGFLSQVIELPAIRKRKTAVAKLVEFPKECELKYTHFSVVFDKQRRFARFTAVNIDGNSLVRNSNVKATWKRDGRIDEEIQPNDDFYAEKLDGEVVEEVVYFQRGHLVRRVDPSWGTMRSRRSKTLSILRMLVRIPGSSTIAFGEIWKTTFWRSATEKRS